MSHRRCLSIVFLAVVFALAASPLLAKNVSIRGYFTVAFKDTAYQQRMVAKVIAKWKRPDLLPAVGKKAVFMLGINREGKIGYIRLDMSSGSKAFDATVEKCLNSASPFDPLPASFRYPIMEVQYHFEVIP